MDQMDRNRLIALLWLIMPVMGWVYAFKLTEQLTDPKWQNFKAIVMTTHEKPALMLGLLGGVSLASLLTWLVVQMLKSPFSGAYFKRHLRGRKIVTDDKLKSLTAERKTEQVMVGAIPMPTRVESYHLLFGGSTGTGKSVAIRSLCYSAVKRGDRLVVADPNGDLLSKFYRPGDMILNPYDTRTQGWSFFNEIRNDYDYKRYALSIVPRGQSAEAEEWCSFGRLLLAECAKKLALTGNTDVRDLFQWTTIEQPEELKQFLAGTAAESLFVGADKALASARFVLADKLPEHLAMPNGDFSIRRFLEDDQRGNLFLTWREDMAVSLRPLISAWVDVVCSSVLSLPENDKRRIWLVLDELASLEKLASLKDALTKGRKHGLRCAAGLQTVAQLDDIYGPKEAQTLRACFRSLVVLGGANTDVESAKVMSESLGEHEVLRDKKTRGGSSRGATHNTSPDIVKERVVTPTEVQTLPELTAIVAFAGDLPIARTKLNYQSFKTQTEPFAERFGMAVGA